MLGGLCWGSASKLRHRAEFVAATPIAEPQEVWHAPEASLWMWRASGSAGDQIRPPA